jgi:uncharacterized protein
MPNKLAGETSPYLLQHKDNPVEWYPWGDEALVRARTEDKPMLVSIGYSSCHWCHVMAHQSFENDAIAHQMNDGFVNIKVDREERPDLDGIYMTAVQAMSGQGGWPLNVFLTPEGVPFFGGTYWPPRDQGGMPGFPRVLDAVRNAWETNREGVLRTAGQIRGFLEASAEAAPAQGELSPEIGSAALRQIETAFDTGHGGFGGAPKFPQASVLEFLARRAVVDPDGPASRMLIRTLDGMAHGGMYDQIGGGFARYAVDAAWLVPHFEKMLYDNAQLVSLYTHAWLASRSGAYRQVVEQSIGWALREMRAPGGAFYAALDADSEGVEGKFYTWTPDEIDSVLPPEQADLAKLYYGVTASGNFEGASILHVARPLEELAAAQDHPVEDLDAELASARERLLATREQRVRPGTDTKVIVSWNGLMIKALAQAGLAFDRPDWTAASVAAADTILTSALGNEGTLARTLTGGTAAGSGMLEDYAFLADGLLALYTATSDSRWLTTANDLLETVRDRFRHSSGVGYFDTSTSHESLIVRPRELQDGAIPSGNAVILDVMWTLSHLREDIYLSQEVLDTLGSLAAPMAEHPLAFGRFLAVLERTRAGARQVVIAGAAESAAGNSLREVVIQQGDPGVVLAYAVDGPLAADWPTLADRPLPGGAEAAAFVCQGRSCLPPVTHPDDLARLLAAAVP